MRANLLIRTHNLKAIIKQTKIPSAFYYHYALTVKYKVSDEVHLLGINISPLPSTTCFQFQIQFMVHFCSFIGPMLDDFLVPWVLLWVL